MRPLQALVLLALASQSIEAASLPESSNALQALAERAPDASAVVSPDHTLERRKGGGGRGGGSSGGRSGGGSGSGSGPPARSLPNSFAGGSTRLGSGPSRGYGGGNYYGGGASVPYSAGDKNRRGLGPTALLPAALVLAIMPGIWLYSVWPYHYTNPYRYYNHTPTAQFPNGTNASTPVMCLCSEQAVCSCEENEDQTYLGDLIGNGSWQALNKSLINVADVNGTTTIVLNGSLPNGTTAPGGTDDSSAVHLLAGKYTGYWAMTLIVLFGVFM